MAQTRTTCPRCRQPVLAEVEQLLDQNTDPDAKQKLLSGAVNMVQCPSCGFQGPLNLPIVYHDPEKELLLTFFPPELGVPVNEQERLLGPMITQAVNRLPAEKRKAYLFRPQTMLTMQTMIERILEADGITKEMIEGQQKRMNLLQRLATTPGESRIEIIRQEEALIDQNFFNILNSLIEASMAQNDERSARLLAGLQKDLLENTETGRQLLAQAQEAEAAVKSLQEASREGLTREKLLDLILAAPSETRLNTLASLARNGLDYQFFQILSERIAQADEAERQHLISVREKLTELTSRLDKAAQEHVKAAQDILEQILAAPNTEEATAQAFPAIDQTFIEVLKSELETARQKGDLQRSAKLQTIAGVIQQASRPPEIDLIEELVSLESDEERMRFLEQNAEKITPEFMQMFASLTAQLDNQEEAAELRDQLKAAYRLALRFSMKRNLKS